MGKLSREPSNGAFFATPSRVIPIVRLSSVKSLKEVWVKPQRRRYVPGNRSLYTIGDSCYESGNGIYVPDMGKCSAQNKKEVVGLSQRPTRRTSTESLKNSNCCSMSSTLKSLNKVIHAQLEFASLVRHQSLSLSDSWLGTLADRLTEKDESKGSLLIEYHNHRP
ncbi:hypothetical protein M9H77_23679 [Catharanthus roseus]|uniref:Uncharacterized protein n=1 Tax=Catharanthus roseus TaxID=4058 RepID=A0ACC0AUR2_CATRO|nr:hypothetical protein M9H77_23679 [Catharanthus roseus]